MPPLLEPGTVLGPLTIEERLGFGTFSEIYRAQCSLIGDSVAVKSEGPGRESAPSSATP